MEEIWKVVPSHPAYEVSNFGQIRSPRKVLKPSKGHGGYLQVCLSFGNKPKPYQIHILVNTLFNGPKPNSESMTLHRDDNKDNCRADNLYWGTHKENTEDAIRNGKYPAGTNHWLAKVTVEQVNEIRQIYEEIQTLKQRLHSFGLSPSTISAICKNRTYKTTDKTIRNS